MKGLKGQIPDYYSYEIDQTIRHKIIGTIFDFQTRGEMDDLNIKIEREFGKSLPIKPNTSRRIEEFLFKCDKDEFLTSIELLIVIKLKNILNENDMYDRSYLAGDLKKFINTVNKIFKIDKIGYEIVPVNLPDLRYIIVPYNSQYLYLETIKRPISLMHSEDFKGPLNEFEDALDEYRQEEYKDSIHKANKAYESTLKTILELKSIEYSATDSIPKLVEKIRNETALIDSSMQTIFDSFWSVLQNGPPNIRNLEGIGHGQGSSIKEVEKSFADFVLRLAGTYIVFLIERYKETK